MHGDKELTERVAELEAKVADLEAGLKSYTEAFVVVGRWLKALANNDTVVLKAAMSAASRKRQDEAQPLFDQIFGFRDEIEEKIKTDEID